jgi:hypothetical protein
MASEKPGRDPLLAAIEAKISAWTAVRESYLAAVAVDVDGPLSEFGGVTIGSTARVYSGSAQQDLPVGVFRDKTLKEAIPIYLAAGRRKQTNKEIAVGLQAGGFPTTAENFEATVTTALYRLRKERVVLRFPDGWDIASSYPESLRGRLENDSTQRKTKRRRRQRAGSIKATKHSETVPRTRTKAVKASRKKPDTATHLVEPHLKAV